MCLSYHKIKFENYVLLSGIAESLFVILYKVFRYDFFVLLAQSFQILITMFISRRFLKLYLILDRKNNRTHIYNTYFIALVIINVICILVSLGFCIYSFQGNQGIHDEYISYSHSGFSCLVSIFLFLFSFQIHKMIIKSLKYSSQGLIIPPEVKEDYLYNYKSNEDKRDNVNNKTQEENNQSPIELNDKEIYFKTRKKQLYIVALSNVMTDTLEFVFYSIKLFLMGEEYFTFSMKTFAKSKYGFAILVCEQLSLLFSSLFNYIAFYFIIREMYEEHIQPNKENNLLDSEIKKNTIENHNCIADYLAS